MENQNLTVLDHIKLLAQEALKKINSLVSELATTTGAALEEMEAAKQDKFKSVSVTVPVDSWNDAAEEEKDPYAVYCDVALEGVTEKDMVDVYIAADSTAAAESSGVSPVCESIAGAVRLWAESKPSAELKADCRIIKD